MENPRGLTVTLTDASTNYLLLTLLQALDTDFNSPAYQSCRYLCVQVDVNEGADVVSWGNVDLSSTNTGRQLVATQFIEIFGGPGDTIALGTFYLRTTVAGTKVNVTVEFA